MSNKLNTSSVIFPDWKVNPSVKALVTTRNGGESDGEYSSFNLASHVGDSKEKVGSNRKYLKDFQKLPSDPLWLNQVHGTECVSAKISENCPTADASFTQEANQVLAVLTADCMPILMTNIRGDWIAACHAGWRGLLDGVVESTINKYQGDSSDLIAWIGPAISKKHFEVGLDVYDMFCEQHKSAAQFFSSIGDNKFLFDYIGLAKQKMCDLGIEVYRGEYCTYDNPDLFYSYRRDGETGRMASLIWIES